MALVVVQRYIAPEPEVRSRTPIRFQSLCFFGLVTLKDENFIDFFSAKSAYNVNSLTLFFAKPLDIALKNTWKLSSEMNFL